MNVSRRSVLKASAVAATAAAVGLPARTAAAATAPAAPVGTTLDQTLLVADRTGRAGGYAPVLNAPGEPVLLRTDLGGVAQPGREGRRRTLLAFAQISDVHVVDCQSPARLEYLDRFNDGPVQVATAGYRPQEMLSAQVADAMVRRINQIGVGPITGTPLAFTIQTGDNSDNAQYNEVRWNIDLLDGRYINPDSAGGGYAGVMDGNALYYDTHYWHPEGTPLLRSDDQPRSQFGFPVVK